MQSAFPILLLPPEIRTQIYHFSLVDPSAVLIEMSTIPIKVSSSEPLRAQQEVHLSHVRDVFDLPFEMNTSLLLACRTIYQEASSVLYSSTSFQFSTPWSTAHERNRCYDTLMCFGARLSEPNRASIQKIEMEFPGIEPRRAADGRSDFLAKACDGLKTLKTFPALRDLKLHLSQDILSWDILLLNRIQLTIPSTCQVLVEFGEIKSYRLHCSFEYRSVRISDEAIWQMTEFLGWKVYGNMEVVGEGHEFSDVSRWVQCLEQSRSHGQTSGAAEV